MNTTQLIAHWTMHGTGRDLDGRFRKTDDIRKVLAAHQPPPAGTAPETLRVRGAGEEDWTALRVGGEGAGGRVW